MGENEVIPWASWRIQRLLQILELKALGFTDAQVAERMPISRATVSRELNSPQAAEIGKDMIARAVSLIWRARLYISLKLSDLSNLIKLTQSLLDRGESVPDVTNSS